MKEQNKPENHKWIRDLSLLKKADTNRTVILFDNGETCPYNYGTWPFAKAVAFYEHPLPERTFNEAEVISMLEALRQRCAEAGKTYVQPIFEDSYQSDIEAIDLTEFIPPLTK